MGTGVAKGRLGVVFSQRPKHEEVVFTPHERGSVGWSLDLPVSSLVACLQTVMVHTWQCRLGLAQALATIDER